MFRGGVAAQAARRAGSLWTQRWVMLLSFAAGERGLTESGLCDRMAEYIFSLFPCAGKGRLTAVTFM